MSAAHTLGPWRLQFGKGIQYDYIINAPSGCPVACFSHHKQATKKETKANARLIAAAPDLLEALREMVAGDADAILEADAIGIPFPDEMLAAYRKAVAA